MTGFPKPMKGAALLASRERRADRVAAEQAEMQAALKRDERKCRVPRCEYAGRKLPIDPCHKTHRGMGGDPTGFRTTRETIVSLCRIHHGMWDRGALDIETLHISQGFDGPCAFYVEDESGRSVCIGIEKKISISETRKP
jgi:hypothetical protein